MLVQLIGEQAANHWDFIKYGIEEALPPVTGMQSDRMSNILTAILTGKMIVWVNVNKEKECEIEFFLLTSLNSDSNSGTKSLLIYALYGYQNSTNDSWSSGLETLTKYAKSEGCHRIIAYSDVPSVISFVERIGGDVRFRLLSLPI